MGDVMLANIMALTMDWTTRLISSLPEGCLCNPRTGTRRSVSLEIAGDSEGDEAGACKEC